MGFDTGILKSLANKELVLPYLELGMLSDKWPEHYTIDVDSGEYYGKGDGYFHPSTHPLMSVRQLYYMFHPDTRDKMVRQRETMASKMTLAMGSALHAVVQTQMEMVGLLKPSNIEKEFVIHEHHVRGRIDMIVDHPDGQYIVEMKTMKSRLFKFCKKMKPEWDAQMSLQEFSQGMDKGVLLLVERGEDMNMREFFHQRNDALLTEIFDKFDLVRKCVENNTPPGHCCGLPDSKEVSNCPARLICWPKED